MHIDFHYYGTYALARAAGLNQEAARIVATAAQFVDDNAAKSHVDFEDGARIDQDATAHHLVDIANCDARDQRRVWVPFHFLPGNQGDSYTERLKCRKDSDIAQEMRDHHLSITDRDFGLHLLGITAHVYADTFSHYGFSGVSSRGNKVDNGSFRFGEDAKGVDGAKQLSEATRDHVGGHADRFFENFGLQGGHFANIKSFLGEKAYGTLGHGAVAKFPDYPYLVWNFDYEREDAQLGGITAVRDNPSTYLEACRALYEMFRSFVQLPHGERYSSGDHREFGEIEAQLTTVLSAQSDKMSRCKEWKEGAPGSVFGNQNEEMPDYGGQSWNEQWDGLNGQEEYSAATDLDVWRFYQAASLHRIYVLRDLLPKHGLIVD